jgi:hypothetical protein
MNDFELLLINLKRVKEIAERNISKADNIDLTQLSQDIDNWIDELNSIGRFETYQE